ncbi:MAG: hypothetical protein ACREDN_06380 [Aestuariivirga sp.]
MAQAGSAIGEAGGFDVALRQMRAAEAAHLEARRRLSDAKTLRLQVLKDELAAIVAASPQARAAFELAMAPGEPPRLWIDLSTAIVMEPDPKTYRLVRNAQGGHETLFETAEVAEMVQQAKLHMAHGIIAHQRQMALPAVRPCKERRYSTACLIITGLAGFGFGALTLLSAAICLKILYF